MIMSSSIVPQAQSLTINAMLATDGGVIIPMQCEYYAPEGLADLSQTIERLQDLNEELHIRGVVRLFDARNTLANDVSAELGTHFGVSRIIPLFRVRTAESRSRHARVRL